MSLGRLMQPGFRGQNKGTDYHMHIKKKNKTKNKKQTNKQKNLPSKAKK